MSDKPNTRHIGTKREEQAARWLREQGCLILERNFHCKCGEIDLIAMEEQTLLFVEVKYRKNAQAGYPAEAVNWRKQKKIIQTALYYMRLHRMSSENPCRFDVVSILGDEPTWIKNAFFTG